MAIVNDKSQQVSAKFSIAEAVRKCVALFSTTSIEKHAEKPDNSAGIAQIDKMIAEAQAKKTPEELAITEKQVKIAKRVIKEDYELLKRLSQT